MKYKYLFGPVPSRRLGLSLGVDLIPKKVCSLNCVYCESGKTTNLTVDRKEYIRTDAIIKELKSFFDTNPELDYITFSGAGEPTLNSNFNEITSFIKENYPQYKLALITNSTLFGDEKLRKEMLLCDLILPSLDAVTDESFNKICRPNKEVKVKNIIKGLADLKKEFKGQMWLEVFIVPGINDSEEDLQELVKAVEEINPDIVQLNSLDRPGTEDWVLPADEPLLKKIACRFMHNKVEITAKFKSQKKANNTDEDVADRILELISRRPCIEGDLVDSLGVDFEIIKKEIKQLLEKNKITTVKKDRGTFYKIYNSWE